MDIISIIIKYREKNNLSINKLAELVGVGVSTLSRIEKGETEKIDYSLVAKLKIILNIPDEEILASMNSYNIKSNTNIQLINLYESEAKCDVCNKISEKGNVKELIFGTNYKKGTNLCKKCRKELLKILEDEY